MVGWHPRLHGRDFWASSRSWWWTGRPGVPQSMGLQRIGHDWASELNWLCCLLQPACLTSFLSLLSTVADPESWIKRCLSSLSLLSSLAGMQQLVGREFFSRWNRPGSWNPEPKPTSGSPFIFQSPLCPPLCFFFCLDSLNTAPELGWPLLPQTAICLWEHWFIHMPFPWSKGLNFYLSPPTTLIFLALFSLPCRTAHTLTS